MAVAEYVSQSAVSSAHKAVGTAELRSGEEDAMKPLIDSGPGAAAAVVFHYSEMA